MSDEITGYRGFHPSSGAYVVKDRFELKGDGQLKFSNQGETGDFDDGYFTLIRSYDVCSGRYRELDRV